MITIGVDAHNHLHVATALDAAGRVIDRWQGPNSPDGWAALLAWGRSQRRRAPRRWGIEGDGHYGRGLTEALLAEGEQVYDINPRWTALARRSGCQRGKSDRLDAAAVARYLWQEGAELVPLVPEDETAVLDLLVRERAAAVAETTRLRNQFHALLLQFDPQYKGRLPALTTPAGVAAMLTYEAPGAGALAAARAAGVRRLAERLQLATAQAEALKRETEDLARVRFAPLTELKGVALLTAGTLAGILRAKAHVGTEAQLAAHAGAAPLPAFSAGRCRHYLNRGGSRQLNAVLHCIELVQERWHPSARTYSRPTAEGREELERSNTRAQAVHLTSSLAVVAAVPSGGKLAASVGAAA
jgi:transposase